MRLVTLFASILALCLIVPSAGATTYVVNPEGTGDFPTIQAAIDAVQDGDIIELTNGIFTGDGNRDIDYLGKAITLTSQSGNPEACIIDCQGSEAEPHRGFYLHSGEEADSRLEGVTIANAYAQGHGGGIRCTGYASPSIVNCVFLDDAAAGSGGGLSAEGSITLAGCVFSGNHAGGGGGGLHFWNDHPKATLPRTPVLNCVFIGNSASYGGAIYFSATPILLDLCTFGGNSAGSGGAVSFHWNGPILRNCTLAGNVAECGSGLAGDCHPTLENTIICFGIEGEAISCLLILSASLSCCNIYGNEGGDWIGSIATLYGVDGNISEDPEFCSPVPHEHQNWMLQSDSPCAPFSPPNPECDLIGAWPVGCGDTPVTETTWGGIKAMFRQ